MAGIAGDELAGEPRPCRGRSARHGQTVRQLLTKTNRASARVLAFQDLKRGRSAQPTRTVRDLVREHVFHPTRSATDRRTVRHLVRRSDRTVRFPNPDGPQLTVQHPFTHSCTPHLSTLCPVFIPQFSLVKACILLSLAIIARIHSMIISQTSFAFV